MVVLPLWVAETYIGVSNVPTMVYSVCFSGNSSAPVESLSVTLSPIFIPSRSLLEFSTHSSSAWGILPPVRSMQFIWSFSPIEYILVL